MTNLTEALDQFNRVLNQVAPNVANRLQPGLARTDIERAITKFSWNLPQDGYALYQRHLKLGRCLVELLPVFLLNNDKTMQYCLLRLDMNRRLCIALMGQNFHRWA